MAEYNKKWADLFPATIGNQNRPSAGVDNTLPYETDKFPQHIANDPVRYDKMNAVISQVLSNDERLNEKIKRTSDDLAAHNKDPKAHATGISGNAATASKLTSPRTLSLTGKAAGSTTFDGSANATINVTSVNADTASKLSTARKINITGNASGSANFDGTSDVNINVTVNSATKAVNDGNGANIASTYVKKAGDTTTGKITFASTDLNALPEVKKTSDDNMSGVRFSSKTKFLGAVGKRLSNGEDLLNLRSDNNTTDVVLDSRNYNNYAPTKTGGGASGTWGINISGNAATATTANALNGIINREPATNNHAIIPGAFSRDYCEFHEFGAVWKFIETSSEGSTTVASIRSDGFHGNVVGNAATATNADKLDGYHASDLLRTLGGNRTPVITDIFDRAGTIDMSTMSAADKATHKANINKASNMTQNIWNNGSGIHAYGGDYDIAGYNRGTLKLTQSYKNFDKILVVGTNDDGDEFIPRLYDVWELTYLFSYSYRFLLFNDTGAYWELYGTAKHGTTTNYAVSTDTVWSCQDQNSGIVAIYGIKY